MNVLLKVLPNPYIRYRHGPRPSIEIVGAGSEGSWMWPKDPSTYSEKDKRRLLGKVVEISVETTFNTHFYKWSGKVYRQTKGGAIGLKATGSVAKVAMEDWIRKLHGKLVDKGVQVHLLTKYVDDVLIVVDTMDLGSRWTSEGICSTEETVKEDTNNCRSRQEVTFEVLKQASLTKKSLPSKYQNPANGLFQLFNRLVDLCKDTKVFFRYYDSILLLTLKEYFQAGGVSSSYHQ